jgi:hypothetical protein
VQFPFLKPYFSLINATAFLPVDVKNAYGNRIQGSTPSVPRDMYNIQYFTRVCQPSHVPSHTAFSP